MTDFSQLVDQVPAPQVTNDNAPPAAGHFDDLVAQVASDKQTQAEAVNASLMGTDADKTARAAELGKQFGLPGQAIMPNIGDWSARAQLLKNNSILQSNPSLANWVSKEPGHAAVAQDDFDNLDAISKASVALVQGVEQPVQSIGLHYARVGQAAARDVGLGEDTANEDVAQQKAAIQSYSLYQPTGIYGKTDTVLQAVTGFLDHAIRALPIAGAGALAGLPEAGVGAVPGGVAGMEYGMASSFAVDAAGQVLDATADMKDRNGNPMPEAARQTGAIVAGGLTAGLGLVGLGAESSSLSKSLVGDAVSEAMKRPAISSALMEIGKQTAISGVRGSAMMGAFQVATQIGQELGKQVSPDEWDTVFNSPDIRKQYVGQIADAMEQGFIMMGSMRMVGEGLGQYGNFIKSRDAIKSFSDIADSAGQSKTQARSPDAMASLVQSHTADTGAENVFVPASKIVELYQAAKKAPGPDDGIFGKAVPDIAQQLSQAAPRDGDIVIPTSSYAAHIAGTPMDAQLRPDIRLSADGMSLNEQKAFEAQHADIVQRLDSEFKAAQDNPSRVIYEDIKQKAEATGSTPAQAAQEASLVAARYMTRASRLGLDPVDLYKEQGLELRRGEVPEAGGRELGQEIPKDESSLGESGRPLSSTSITESPGSQEPSRQTSERTPPSGVFTTRPMAPSTLEGGASSGDLSGIGAPYHATDDVSTLKSMASASEGDLHSLLKTISENVEGAELASVRAKDEQSLNRKLGLFQPSQISDYLGGRIIVDNRQAAEGVLAQLQRYGNVTHVDDFLNDEGRLTGYRAIHAQIMGSDGLSAEVQIQPRDINNALPEGHALYKERQAAIAAGDMSKAEGLLQKGKQLYDEAWKRFNEPSQRELFQSGNEAPFYSMLTRSVERFPQEKASAEQWIGTINNMLSKGVKKEEVDWSGIKEWLSEQKGTITKEAVLGHLRSNEVQLHEVMKGAGNEIPQFAVIRKDGQVEGHYIGRDIANSVAEHIGGRVEQGEPFSVDNTKFSSYTLPGGKNYREMLLTLPEKGERQQLTFKQWADLTGHDDTAEARHEFRNTMAAQEPQVAGSNFRSPHFDEPNILAHIRMDDRAGPNGEKILHVEELQSDWHQKGRKNGYKLPADEAAKLEARRREIEEIGMKQGYKDGGVAIDPQLKTEWADIMNRLQPENTSRVPDAPFKTSWPEMAFKRVLRYAAENGYDKVSWTTGEQQAERYDLSKHIDRIGYTELKSGKYNISAEKDGKSVMSEDRVDLARVEEMLGKEIAEKIKNKEGYEYDTHGGNSTRELTGLDLKVGGEGMRGFYDKILPSIANRIGKRYGAEVGETPIKTDEVSVKSPGDGSYVLENQNGTIIGRYRHQNEAQLAADSFNQQKANTQVHSLPITDAMRESVMQGQTLFQTERGKIMLEEARAIITRFASADRSTLLHEFGHLWLEELKTDALRADAPQQLKDDWATIQKYIGHEGEGAIATEAHETFARSFEQYLMEGKAPSNALLAPFRRFKQWLTNIYRSVSGLGVNLSDDARQVFDRMLASDDEIKQMEQRQSVNRLFRTKEQAGMSDAQFRAYNDAATNAEQAAREQLLTEAMEAVAKKNGKEWNAAKAEIRPGIEKTINAQQNMRVLDAFRTGKLRDETGAEADIGEVKIGKAALQGMYADDPEIESKLPKGIVTKDGANPDELASIMGYANGREMIDDLVSLGKDDQAMRAAGGRSLLKYLADREVEKQVGDRFNLSPEEMQARAEALTGGVDRMDLKLAELRALAKKSGNPVTFTRESIKAWAGRQIEDMNIKAASNVFSFVRAIGKAGRDAQRAVEKGDDQGAFQALQRQALNMAMAEKAREAQAIYERGMRNFKYAASKAVIKSTDQAYLDQVHGLLSQFGFNVNRDSVELRNALAGKSLADFLNEKNAEGRVMGVPDFLLAQNGPQKISDLSFGQFRDMRDAVASILHNGRDEKSILQGNKKVAFDAVKQSILALRRPGEVVKLPTRAQSDAMRRSGVIGRILAEPNKDRIIDPNFIPLLAGMRRTEDYVQALDNDKELGPTWSTLYSPLSDAADREAVLRAGEKTAFDEFRKTMPAGWTKFLDREFTAEKLPDTYTGEPARITGAQAIGMALNLGNKSNLDKMLRGEKWDENSVRDFLNSTLEKHHWDMAQFVIDRFEKHWPDTEALYRKLNGIAPTKIEATPIETPHGTYRGGYFPVIYDPIRATEEMVRQSKLPIEGGIPIGKNLSFMDGMTSSGRTITRTDFAAPLLYDLNAIVPKLNEAIHDLAFRESIINANKFLNSPTIANEINERLGNAGYSQLREAIRDFARPYRDDRALAGINQLMQVVNQRAVQVGVMFRMSTIVKHFSTMFSRSFPEIGPQWMIHGLKTFYGDPMAETAKAYAEAPMLKYRMDSIMTDMKQGMESLQGASTLNRTVQQIGHYGIGLSDQSTAIPAYIGARDRALSEGRTQDEAVETGKLAVRNSHGGNRDVDLPALLRTDNQFLRSLSLFYSVMNHAYNRGVLRTARDIRYGSENIGQGNYQEAAGNFAGAFARTFFYFVVPGIAIGTALGTKKDDESWGEFEGKNVANEIGGTLPFVRSITDAYFMGSGKEVSLSPVGRMIDTVFRKEPHDVANALGLTNAEVSPTWLRDTLDTTGYLTGAPVGGQPAQTAQFLWDYAHGYQNPHTAQDFMRGIVQGKSEPKH